LFVAIFLVTALGFFGVGGVEWRLAVGTELVPAVKVISRTAIQVVPVGCLLVLLPLLHLVAKFSQAWKPKQARWLGALLGLAYAYAWGAFRHGGLWQPQLQDKRIGVLALAAILTGASFGFNYATLIQNRLRKRTKEDLF
jgi:hypothetical protein